MTKTANKRILYAVPYVQKLAANFFTGEKIIIAAALVYQKKAIAPSPRQVLIASIHVSGTDCHRQS
jgi:hypothetical protein